MKNKLYENLNIFIFKGKKIKYKDIGEKIFEYYGEPMRFLMNNKETI